jgi:cell division septal protein FtsQ
MATQPRRGVRRGWIAAAVLLVEAGVLAGALTLPAFRVRTVAVSGNRLLSSAVLLRAAGVPASSIFTVNGTAVRTRLLQLPWLADATVTTELPGTVRIAVTERTPVLRIRSAAGDLLVADDGAELPASSVSAAVRIATPVLVDDRVGSPAPPSAALLQMLGTAAQRFPQLFGCSVAAFQWGVDGVLAVWASPGWRAVLGHADTDAAIAEVPAQLAALAALKGQLDLLHPSFGYVDLENPAAPAVGGRPGLPAEISAAATADPAGYPPGAVAPPVSTPSPTAAAPSATPTTGASAGASSPAASTPPSASTPPTASSPAPATATPAPAT